MKVVILAGGLPSTLTDEKNIPKPMVEIGERPLLWHIMKHFSYYGYNDFIICAGLKSELIKEYFVDYYIYESDVQIDLSSNEVKLLNKKTENWNVSIVDTGLSATIEERIKKIEYLIGEEDFFITYGDVISNIDLKKLYEEYKNNQTILTAALVHPTGRSRLINVNDNRILYNSDLKNTDAWINSSTMVANRKVFDFLGKNSDPSARGALFDKLSQENEINVYYHKGFWRAVETMRDKSDLENMWQSGNPVWKIWED